MESIWILRSENEKRECNLFLIEVGLLQPKPTVESSPRSKQENGIPRIRRRIEDPIMNIPHQINQQSIQEYALIPPKIPLQSLHFNHHLLIHVHTQQTPPRRRRSVLPNHLYHHVVARPALAESRPRRVNAAAAGEPLAAGNQRGFRFRQPLRLPISEDEGQLRVHRDRHVESGDRLRPRLVPRAAEVPVDVGGQAGGGIEALRAALAAEGLETPAQFGGGEWVVGDRDGEGLTQRIAPADPDQKLLLARELDFVNGGDGGLD